MRYALINEGIVYNIICLHSSNMKKFPNAIAMNDIPVCIGDEYKDGYFYRNGDKVMTEIEKLQKINQEQEMIIAELDAALINTTYDNLILTKMGE